MYISLWERTGNSPLSIEIHILAFHFNNSIVFLNPLQQSPTQVNRRGPLYSGTEGRLPPIFIPAGHHGHSHVTTQPKGGKKYNVIHHLRPIDSRPRLRDIIASRNHQHANVLTCKILPTKKKKRMMDDP